MRGKKENEFEMLNRQTLMTCASVLLHCNNSQILDMYTCT